MKAVVAVAMAVMVGVCAAPASAAGWKSCGSYTFDQGWTYGPTTGAGHFGVKAKKVSCRKARHIVLALDRWDSWFADDGNSGQWWRGPWTCNYRSTGYESARLWCIASYGRRVKWTTAA